MIQNSFMQLTRPHPQLYSISLQMTIQLNAALNQKSQHAIDSKEPGFSIWEVDELEFSLMATASALSREQKANPSRFSGLKRAFSIKSSDEKEIIKRQRAFAEAKELRDEILKEENGRWPNQDWRSIVSSYQVHIAMDQRIAAFRARKPIQYLHLLRAGYFEPIPVSWANNASNPLKFSIEASAGWRGITPAWRGYEDTAEERLYWVLNHREGSSGNRLKPDVISALTMARSRMASAVEPPPAYFSTDDTCHIQHTSKGYSRQVMPPPFRPFDGVEVPTDDTMILLDVSGSMDFQPVRPIYNEYLIEGYTASTQPRNRGT